MAEDFEVGGPPPEEAPNRTFIIVAGAIGGLLVLSMICLAGYALYWAPRQRAARDARATEIVLQNTQVAQSLTETAQAARPTFTSVPTRTPRVTEPPTPTQVVALAATDTPAAPTVAPETATAAAEATQLALAEAQTPTPTATALPVTGFADEVGLPGLFLMGLALVVLVFVARRLRSRAVT